MSDLPADIIRVIYDILTDIRAAACVCAAFHAAAAEHQDMLFWRTEDPEDTQPKLFLAAQAVPVRELIRLRKYRLLGSFGYIFDPVTIVRSVNFADTAAICKVIDACKNSYAVDSLFYHAVSIGAVIVVTYLLQSHGDSSWFSGVIYSIYPRWAGILYTNSVTAIARDIIATNAGHPCKCAACAVC